MAQRAAIEGEYADFKIVRTRSVAQLVVEVPIEEGDALIRMFGLPQPGKSVRVAVARLAEPTQIEAKANGDGREHGPWHTLTPTLQAVLRCKSEAFWKFLREDGTWHVENETDAATVVRQLCGVNSRSSLIGKAAEKWARIDRDYETWLRTPAP